MIIRFMRSGRLRSSQRIFCWEGRTASIESAIDLLWFVGPTPRKVETTADQSLPRLSTQGLMFGTASDSDASASQQPSV